MPRCDVVLPNGTFTNATIVVENGCVVDVQGGMLQVYTPDLCCPTTGGTGTGDGGLDGPPGPPGINATVSMGSVTSLAANALPTVTNVGTATAAILNFGIPRGADGADGSSGTVGETQTAGGIVLLDGLIKDVPVQWPPIMNVEIAAVSTPGVTFTAIEDPNTGTVTFTFSMSAYAAALELEINGELSIIASQLVALQTQVVSLQEAVLVCCPAAVLDLNGDGAPDPGGVPGVSPPPPIGTN